MAFALALTEGTRMSPEDIESLMSVLGLDAAGLAGRLGDESRHYEKLKQKDRLAFPVWDALQRFAYRVGYVWNPGTKSWTKRPPVSATAV